MRRRTRRGIKAGERLIGVRDVESTLPAPSARQYARLVGVAVALPHRTIRPWGITNMIAFGSRAWIELTCASPAGHRGHGDGGTRRVGAVRDDEEAGQAVRARADGAELVAGAIDEHDAAGARPHDPTADTFGDRDRDRRGERRGDLGGRDSGSVSTRVRIASVSSRTSGVPFGDLGGGDASAAAQLVRAAHLDRADAEHRTERDQPDADAATTTARSRRGSARGGAGRGGVASSTSRLVAVVSVAVSRWLVTTARRRPGARLADLVAEQVHVADAHRDHQVAGARERRRRVRDRGVARLVDHPVRRAGRSARVIVAPVTPGIGSSRAGKMSITTRCRPAPSRRRTRGRRSGCGCRCRAGTPRSAGRRRRAAARAASSDAAISVGWWA